MSKSSNPKLKVTLEFDGKEKLDEILNKLLKPYNLDVNSNFSAIAGSINTNIHSPLERAKSAFKAFKGQAVEFGLAFNGVERAIRTVITAYNMSIGAFVESAAQFEQIKLRLVSLYQDTDKAEIAFEKFREVAAKTPATLLQVAEAGSTLRAFGLDAEAVIESVTDLAAYMGMDLVEAASAVGRSFAGGVGASEIFRERGVMALIKSFSGIEDLTKLALPEFRKVMLETLSDPAGGISGAADRMAQSYTGAVSNMKAAFINVKAHLGQGITPYFATMANALGNVFNKLSDTKTGLDAAKESIIGQRVEFERLVMVYKDLHFNQNRSKEQNEKYARTISDLMAKYPNYLGKVNLEKDNWDTISKRLETARYQLQQYVNLKIQEAVIKQGEDEIVKLAVKMTKNESDLELLRAEFLAGTKKRVTDVKTVTNPLSGSPNPGTSVGLSKWGEQEFQLERAIAKQKEEEEKLNQQLNRRVEAAMKMYAVAPAPEAKIAKVSGSGGGEKESASGGDHQTVMQEIERYRILRKENFDEELGEIAVLKKEYLEKAKLLAGNADAERDLTEKRDREISEIQKKYAAEREAAEAEMYEGLKFYHSGYYEWKKAQLEKEAADSTDVAGTSWLADMLKELEKDRKEWDDRSMKTFEDSYNEQMSRLAELRDLGLVPVSEVAKFAWESYAALLEVIRSDEAVSEAEEAMLSKYLKRAQLAQLAVNRDSDLAAYYNEVKFHDERYFAWKKERIEEDVRLLELSKEEKAKLLKERLQALREEAASYVATKGISGLIGRAMGLTDAEQATIVGTFQTVAGQVTSIWSRMYNNLSSERDRSLSELEKRAKSERKSDAWLAAEKEKINEQFEKKQRAMKKTEQKMQIASGLANTYEGVTNALTIKPAWLAPIAAASIGALGLANVKFIADQKFAEGGLFRGKGTGKSDSNIVAISDHEYIINAERVRQLGVPFLDALNFGDGKKLRSALSSIRLNVMPPASVDRVNGYATGGYVGKREAGQSVMNVVLKCDGKQLAKAVLRGNRKIIST